MRNYLAFVLSLFVTLSYGQSQKLILKTDFIPREVRYWPLDGKQLPYYDLASVVKFNPEKTIEIDLPQIDSEYRLIVDKNNMNAYFESLFVFLILFALMYVLAYLPGVLPVKKWVKQNSIFLASFGLMYILAVLFGNQVMRTSYVLPICFMLLIFNVYLLFSNKIKRWGKVWNILVDIAFCFLALFTSTCIFAYMDDLPVRNVIFERFDNGGYRFIPGYLPEIIKNSIIFSIIILNFKYIHRYLLDKWEKRQKKKIGILQSQKKNIEIQFEALQAKVNPHFLYNSLNSIAGLAIVDGDKTRQMALALSRFFRYSMNREQEIMISLKEDAEMIGTYLEIEKIRFGTMLNYNIDLPDHLQSYKVPRMLLQPIVENCIKHGMKGDIELLNVSISFSLSGETLIISIKDDGKPFADDFIPGYGIRSVYEKLDLLFPDKYKIELNTYPEKDFRIYLYQGNPCYSRIISNNST